MLGGNGGIEVKTHIWNLCGPIQVNRRNGSSRKRKSHKRRRECICRLYRTIWRPKKATKSATFEIPNWFHKSLKNQRHICSTFIRKFVNDVWSSKQWTSDSLEQRLFLRPFWPYSLHTFSLVSLVKKYATCKAKMAFQKAFVHGNLTFIVFLIPSLTFFIMNVEKIQFFRQMKINIFTRY